MAQRTLNIREMRKAQRNLLWLARPGATLLLPTSTMAVYGVGVFNNSLWFHTSTPADPDSFVVLSDAPGQFSHHAVFEQLDIVVHTPILTHLALGDCIGTRDGEAWIGAMYILHPQDKNVMAVRVEAVTTEGRSLALNPDTDYIVRLPVGHLNMETLCGILPVTTPDS